MKILIIAYSLPPAGGAEKVAWDIAKQYSTNNEVYFLTFGKSFSKDIIEGINIIFLKRKKRSFLYYLTIGKHEIYNRVKEIKPDLIHAHALTIIAYSLRKYAAKKIITFHHSEILNYKWNKNRVRKFEFLEKGCALNYDKVTTVSKHMALYFTQKLNIPVIIIPNGVDTSVFYNMNTNKDSKSIVYIGQLTDAKGVSTLFRLAKELLDYTFTFIGEGVLKGKANSRNTVFTGRINSSQVSKYLNKSEFAIFPSIYENFPLVGLEAMACGTVVIASNTGFSEYITHEKDGFILDFNDFDKLFSILNSRESFEIINKNSQTTIEKYSLKEISKKYLEI